MLRQKFTTTAARRFAPLLAFLRSESAGGAALLLASSVALFWANSPYAPSYEAFLDLPLSLNAGGAIFAMPVQHWVNDGLMALFFLLVSLEIRRELSEGELASLPRAAAPAVAALGGMVVPAAIYAALNWNHPVAMRGWAVPVATDIAFSLAVLRTLGARVPVALKIFLSALAIIDDLGAIVVIAVAYTPHLVWAALGGAVLVWLGLFACNRAGVRAVGVYLLGGIVLWAFVHHSGVHSTMAGVALAFAVPMRELPGEAGSPAHRLEEALSGWVAFLVLPVFGLANAGLDLRHVAAGALTDPLVLGAALGLFLGKQIGVFGTTMIARALGLVRLPAQITTGQLYGAAVLCGIGFTMSLFIGDLAFHGRPQADEIKLAVFLGSFVSAFVGLAVVALATRSRPGHLPERHRG